jgi:hypothetical protein
MFVKHKEETCVPSGIRTNVLFVRVVKDTTRLRQCCHCNRNRFLLIIENVRVFGEEYAYKLWNSKLCCFLD